MKTVLIKQPAGIGDILFCQKIAKVIQENTEYKSVVWPVAPVYSYLEEYMGDDDLHFPVNTDDFPFKEVYDNRFDNRISNHVFKLFSKNKLINKYVEDFANKGINL